MIYHTKFDRYLSFDKAEFVFDPTRPESKRAAFEKMQSHAERARSAIEQHAGRKLSDVELLHGVEHRETRTPAQQIADAMPDLQPRGADIGNPYQYAIDRGWDKDSRKESKAQAYKRKAAEVEAKRQSAAEQAAFDADPARQRAVAHAKLILDSLRYDPSATVEDIEMAETRLHVAQTGDNLAEYAELDAAYQAQRKAKITARTTALDLEIESLRKQQREIETASFNPPEPPAPSPEPTPVVSRYPLVRAGTPEHDEIMQQIADTKAAFNK